MRFYGFFLFILLFWPMTPSMAQQSQRVKDEDQPLRVEISAKSDNETYRVIPCDSNGMIMFFRSVEVAAENQVKWYFSYYDKNLTHLWTKSLPLLNDQDYRIHQLISDTLAILFVHTGKPRSDATDFKILRISLTKGTFILNDGKLPENGEIAAFGIRMDNAWFGINFKVNVGQIGYLRMSTGLLKTFPSGIGAQINIQWIRPDSLGDHVSAIVSRKVSKKTTEYYLVRYDSTGKIQREIPINTNNTGQELNHFQYIEEQPGREMIMGSYGQETGSVNQKNRVAEEMTGLFSGSVVNNSLKAFSFYNFLEMKNVNALVDEREMLNLRKKSSKKNKALNEFSVDFSLLLHEIITWKNQYILISEIYSPQYHTESFTEFDYYGRPYSNNYSVFDGYRYLNAVVTAFDEDGKLLWDNVLEIRNLVSFDLNTKVSAFFNGNDIMLCYLSDGKIGSKIIHEDKVIEKPVFASLEMLYPEDKLLSESKERILPWYGNYFIAYGYQEIKNIALSGNNKRMVFYFSKVRFDK
ncbi:MAG: hypothetical protein M0Q38_01135 [Bacteroidales bacterium]|jgi:hypothetical protein|nr:hypothetical protein [Bacteroidales bacterium]